MSDKIIFNVKQHSGRGSQYGNLDMTISLPYDTTLEHVLEVFERMSLALTYSPNSLITAYKDRLAELEQSRNALKKEIAQEAINRLNEEDYYA